MGFRLRSMPKKLHNWKFKNVEYFLRDNGFVLHHTNGSHYYYIGNTQHLVCVPYHGSVTIKTRTMKGIIAQSGIAQKDWLKD